MLKRLLAGVMAFTMALALPACRDYKAKKDSDASGSNLSTVGTVKNSSTDGSSIEEDKQKDSESKTDMKSEINFWHFNKEEATEIVKEFQKTHPGIKINLTTFSERDDQYINKIVEAINSGHDVPDVFSAESAFVKTLVDMDGAYDDLTDKVALLKNDIIPYTLQVGTDKNGRTRAISHQITVGGIGYKRLVAKKYLGTDDPGQVSQYFASQSKMLEAGKKIRDASHGKVSLFPGWEELTKFYLGGRRDPWVKDNSLVIDQKMIDLIDFAKKLKDNGYEKGIEQWSTEWTNSIADDETALAYCIPTWGVPYVLGENDSKARDGGRWGIAKGPYPYFWQGTWFGIYSKSQKKELAWEFVKWFTTDKDHLKEWNRNTGDIPSSISVLNENAKSSDIDKITGQNLFEFYLSDAGADKINGSLVTDYDGVIEAAYNEAVKAYLKGEIKSKEDTIKVFKSNIRSHLEGAKRN